MKRHGLTLVETVVALAIAGVMVAGTSASIRYFTRPAAANEVTLDQLQALQVASETLSRDLRQARQIIWPEPGQPAARAVYLRDFEGAIHAYVYDPNAKSLRHVRFSLTGLPNEDRVGVASELTGAYFSVNASGLVSWALTAPSRMLMGSVRRVNQ